MNFIRKWWLKRELKKTADAIEKLCDEAPPSFFNGFLFESTGKPLDHVETLNSLMQMANHMRKVV